MNLPERSHISSPPKGCTISCRSSSFCRISFIFCWSMPCRTVQTILVIFVKRIIEPCVTCNCTCCSLRALGHKANRNLTYWHMPKLLSLRTCCIIFCLSQPSGSVVSCLSKIHWRWLAVMDCRPSVCSSCCTPHRTSRSKAPTRLVSDHPETSSPVCQPLETQVSLFQKCKEHHF